MAKGILMPKTGITVEECVLTEWIKKKGDYVKKGDVLFNYETDKSSFECESTEEGILLETFYNEGDDVPVLVNVCAIGQEGDEVDSLRNAPNAAGEAVLEETGQKETQEPVLEKTGQKETQGKIPEGKVQTAVRTGERIKISPRARMAAGKFDVDPALAVPTGAYGRIIERDVRTYVQSRPGDGFGGRISRVQPAADIPAAASERAYTDIPFSGIRKATAKAMTKSLGTMAQLTHFHSFDATVIMNLRKKLRANGNVMDTPDITLNDMVMFAVSRVILKHPDLNATMPEENMLRRYANVHLGMAVDTPKGLMVPTIFDADKKTLAEIAAEAKRLAQVCRDGKARPDMLSGASFTVSNVGSLGCEMFTPVINPPQVGILGVCCAAPRVRETEKGIETYPAMGLALTYDHRAIDGSPASRFLKDLCTALENFDLLMMK